MKHSTQTMKSAKLLREERRAKKLEELAKAQKEKEDATAAAAAKAKAAKREHRLRSKSAKTADLQKAHARSARTITNPKVLHLKECMANKKAIVAASPWMSKCKPAKPIHKMTQEEIDALYAKHNNFAA